MSQPYRFYRLNKSSYIRRYGDYGYIANQLTKHDRVYNASGAEFLDLLKSRKALRFQELLVGLEAVYPDAAKEQLSSNLAEFLGELEADKYIVSGMTTSELDQLEPIFSYSSEFANPKETTKSHVDPFHEPGILDTQSVMSEYLRQNPQLSNLQIELTSHCNEDCRHCYLPIHRNRQNLPSAVLLKVLDEYAAMGGLSVTFSGGEPMLHPDLPMFLRHARGLDLSITLLSNACLLTEPLLNTLKDVNISLIQISVYSMNPDEHDRITRSKGTHAKTLRAIDMLVKADIPLQISCPVMRTNFQSYRDVLQWARHLRVKAYTDFIMMARADGSTDNLDERLNINETEQLLRSIVDYDMEYRMMLDEWAEKIEQSLPSQCAAEKEVCGVGIGMICLSASAIYYPCSSWQGMPVGNATQQTLHEVWKKSPQLEKLRNIRWSSFPQCLTCSDFDFCTMCMVRNFNECNGNYLKIPQQFCDVAGLNHRLIKEYRHTSNT